MFALLGTTVTANLIVLFLYTSLTCFLLLYDNFVTSCFTVNLHFADLLLPSLAFTVITTLPLCLIVTLPLLFTVATFLFDEYQLTPL